jgi:hypothetical protein
MDSKDRDHFDQTGWEMVIRADADRPTEQVPLACAVGTDAIRPVFGQQVEQNYTIR